MLWWLSPFVGLGPPGPLPLPRFSSMGGGIPSPGWFCVDIFPTTHVPLIFPPPNRRARLLAACHRLTVRLSTGVDQTLAVDGLLPNADVAFQRITPCVAPEPPRPKAPPPGCGCGGGGGVQGQNTKGWEQVSTGARGRNSVAVRRSEAIRSGDRWGGRGGGGNGKGEGDFGDAQGNGFPWQRKSQSDGDSCQREGQ